MARDLNALFKVANAINSQRDLHALGISDIVIQAILRHSDVLLTRQSYIKRTGVDDRTVAAMKTLESLICTKHAPEARQQLLNAAV